jgi:hypothetical protein
MGTFSVLGLLIQLWQSNQRNVRFEVSTAVVIFWDMMPCSPSSFNRRFGVTNCPHLQGQRNKFSKNLATRLLAGFAELISSALKMEAICSSEMSVETRRTTRRHIPEDDTLQLKGN